MSKKKTQARDYDAAMLADLEARREVYIKNGRDTDELDAEIERRRGDVDEDSEPTKTEAPLENKAAPSLPETTAAPAPSAPVLADVKPAPAKKAPAKAAPAPGDKAAE